MITNRQIYYKNLGLPSTVSHALEITMSEGIYLYDVNGKRYTDLVSGVSVSNLGHNNERIKDAIKKQIDNYSHLMVYGKFIQEPQTRLARKLAHHLPAGLDCTFFVNSGSEAIEGALKLAKRFTGRTEMVSFRNAYHGGTHGALSMLGNEEMKYAFRPLLPDIRQLRFNHPEDLQQITERTACVLVEPVQAEAGIILPENDFLIDLRARCDEIGALLIFDEIQMGMGRTGRLFSFEDYHTIPDILCLAKAFGGGMPLGAFISSKEIMNSLTHNPELGHITTFGGHPVSCAAACASFDILTTGDLIEKANVLGDKFYHHLKDHPEIKEIRHTGLMMGIDLDNDEITTRLTEIFLKNGIIVDRFLFRPQAFRIAPPLIITENQVEEICEVVINSLDQLSK